MAITISLSPIVTGYNLSKINDNFSIIEEALNDALSRSGNNPNTMSADLDMNSNDILNIGELDVSVLKVGGVEFDPENVTAVGPPGEDGEDGQNATITIGTVTTGAPGSNANVVNAGTEIDAILNFTIPRGDVGESGEGTGDLLAEQNLADLDNYATAFDNIKQSASDSYSGVVELATDAEAVAGSDTTRALTPANGLAAFERKGRVAGIDSKTANYTLVLSDAGKLITMNNSGARTFTIPSQSNVAWLSETRIDFARLGTGTVSFVAGSGVTILSAGGALSLRSQYSGASLIRIANNTWLLVGDIST